MPSIDNRVVQMRFDNKDFEEDIGTSIRSLDRLKSSLKLKDATEGFDEIGRAADRVSQKLTVFGTIGDQILRNIGNEIYSLKNKFIDLAKSMSTDQMRAGWDKYAEKTSAVKTIMSATADQFENEAEQMEYVNEQLDKLNWFTDETSYRLTDMTNNIGKFTNQGQKLDVAVRAMQGIATWAGLSGANVNEASRAMYNLSQAMGIGAVTLIDWKSISNANMATKEFKQTAIDTAVDLGTLKKQADGTYKSIQGTTVTIQNFDQTLSDRWFSSDVLTATLEKFGGFAEVLSDKIQELWENDSLITTSEYLKYITSYNEGTLDLEKAARKTKQTVEELEADLKRLGSSEYDLGRRAFIAAQQAKTFQEAIDATKDAVSSKWLRTFELVFGEYDKARELWTNVANELWNVFAQGLERRNDELEKWVTRGGYQILWRAISDLWATLKQIGSRSWDIWHALFPEVTVNKLMQATYKISTFAYNFKKQLLSLVFTSEELEEKGLSAKDWVIDLTKIMDGFRSGISLVLHVLTELGKWIGIPALNTLFDAFKWGLSVISPFSEKFSEFVNKVKSSKVINKSLTNISTWFNNLKENLKKQENFKKFLENWQKFKDWLSDIKTSALEKIDTFIENLGDMNIQMPKIEAIGDFLNKIFGWINKLIDFSTKIPEAWDSIKSFFSGLDFLSITNFSSSAASLVSNFFTNLFSNEQLENTGRNWITSLWKGIKTGSEEVDDKELFNTIIKALKVGVGAKLGYSLATFFANISKLPMSSIKVVDEFKNVLSSFAKTLRAAAFLQISIGIIAIATAMKILSQVPAENLTDVAVSMALVLGVIALIVNGISGIVGAKEGIGQGNKFRTGNITGIKKFNVKFATLGPALIGFAVALGVIVYAIKQLKDIPKPDRSSALETILAISGILAVFIIMMSLISNFSRQTIKVGDETKVYNFGRRLLAIAISLVLFAAALKIIIGSVVTMADIAKNNTEKPEVIQTAILAIISILIAMGVLIGLATSGKGYFRTILVIAAIFGGLRLLFKPLFTFIKEISDSKIDWKVIAALIGGLTVLLIGIGLALRLMNGTEFKGNGFKFMLNIAIGILAIVGALKLLENIGPISSLSPDIIGQLALLAAGLAVLGFIVGKHEFIGKGMLLIAGSLALFSSAIALAGAGVFLFVKALNLWKHTAPGLKGSGKILAEEISGFIDTLSGVEDKILNFVVKIVGVIITAVIAYKSKITTLGSDMITAFAKGMTGSKGFLIASLVVIIAALLEYLTGEVDNISDALVQILVLTIASLSKAIVKNADLIYEAAVVLAKTIFYVLEYALNSLGDLFTNSLLGKIIRVLELITNPAQLIEAIVTGDWWGTDTVERGYDYLAEKEEELLSLTGDVERQAKKGFGTAIDSVANTIKDKLNLDGIAEEVKDGANDVGENIDKGTAEGVASNGDIVDRAIEDMAKSAINTGEKWFGVNSPSTVFATIGMYIIKGLANGISENSFLATNATSVMANKTIDAFSTVISNISDAINGDFDLDPTIRPVLDLSEIQNGSARISSIIGANRFAFAPDMGFSLDRARSVTAATANLNVGQSNLSEAMMLMQADIASMKADNATIVGVLDRYMPSIPEIAHMQMVTDRGALVGELAPIMDKELGSIASRGRRGRV